MPIKNRLAPWRFRGVYARSPTKQHRARYEIVVVRDGKLKSLYARSREECTNKVEALRKELEAGGGKPIEMPSIPDLAVPEPKITHAPKEKPTQKGTRSAPKKKRRGKTVQMTHLEILRAAMARAMEISDFTAVSRLSKEVREYEADMLKQEAESSRQEEEDDAPADPSLMSEKIMQMGGVELCALAAELSKELWETEGVGLSLKRGGTSTSEEAESPTEP